MNFLHRSALMQKHLRSIFRGGGVKQRSSKFIFLLPMIRSNNLACSSGFFPVTDRPRRFSSSLSSGTCMPNHFVSGAESSIARNVVVTGAVTGHVARAYYQ